MPHVTVDFMFDFFECVFLSFLLSLFVGFIYFIIGETYIRFNKEKNLLQVLTLEIFAVFFTFFFILTYITN